MNEKIFMKTASMFFGIMCVVWGATAYSADLCKAIALTDVPAMEDPSSILPKGSYKTAITGYFVNERTGITGFCSHGGYCRPNYVTINGKKVEALKLTNCRIDKNGQKDGDETYYGVYLIRSKNSKFDVKYNDLDNLLLKMNLCSACASNAAMYYLKEPNSACAKLVKSAIEGNPLAANRLSLMTGAQAFDKGGECAKNFAWGK